MNEAPACLRCQSPMQPGFVMDVGHGGEVRQARWVAGTPCPPKFWTHSEVSADQLKSARPVLTFCCPACGYLESRASRPDPKT